MFGKYFRMTERRFPPPWSVEETAHCSNKVAFNLCTNLLPVPLPADFKIPTFDTAKTIWVQQGGRCDNSDSSHVGLHKLGSSARLRYTGWPPARLRNPARRWHVCHSGTKAHLHNPRGNGTYVIQSPGHRPAYAIPRGDGTYVIPER